MKSQACVLNKHILLPHVNIKGVYFMAKLWHNKNSTCSKIQHSSYNRDKGLTLHMIIQMPLLSHLLPASHKAMKYPEISSAKAVKRVKKKKSSHIRHFRCKTVVSLFHFELSVTSFHNKASHDSQILTKSFSAMHLSNVWQIILY